jgi:hypothetical protein
MSDAFHALLPLPVLLSRFAQFPDLLPESGLAGGAYASSLESLPWRFPFLPMPVTFALFYYT